MKKSIKALATFALTFAPFLGAFAAGTQPTNAHDNVVLVPNINADKTQMMTFTNDSDKVRLYRVEYSDTQRFLVFTEPKTVRAVALVGGMIDDVGGDKGCAVGDKVSGFVSAKITSFSPADKHEFRKEACETFQSPTESKRVEGVALVTIEETKGSQVVTLPEVYSSKVSTTRAPAIVPAIVDNDIKATSDVVVYTGKRQNVKMPVPAIETNVDGLIVSEVSTHAGAVANTERHNMFLHVSLVDSYGKVIKNAIITTDGDYAKFNVQDLFGLGESKLGLVSVRISNEVYFGGVAENKPTRLYATVVNNSLNANLGDGTRVNLSTLSQGTNVK